MRRTEKYPAQAAGSVAELTVPVASPATTAANQATTNNSVLYNINNIIPPEDSRKGDPAGNGARKAKKMEADAGKTPSKRLTARKLLRLYLLPPTSSTGSTPPRRQATGTDTAHQPHSHQSQLHPPKGIANTGNSGEPISHSPLQCRSPLLTELARRKNHLAAKPHEDAPRTVVDGTSRRPAEQRTEQRPGGET